MKLGAAGKLCRWPCPKRHFQWMDPPKRALPVVECLQRGGGGSLLADPVAAVAFKWKSVLGAWLRSIDPPLLSALSFSFKKMERERERREKRREERIRGLPHTPHCPWGQKPWHTFRNATPFVVHSLSLFSIKASSSSNQITMQMFAYASKCYGEGEFRRESKKFERGEEEETLARPISQSLAKYPSYRGKPVSCAGEGAFSSTV